MFAEHVCAGFGIFHGTCKAVRGFEISSKSHKLQQHFDVISIFNMAAAASKFYSRFRFFGDFAQLGRSKSTYGLNFGKISQYTAEILLLPVSENKRLPYWNSTSSFVIDDIADIGKSTIICRPNFSDISQSTAEVLLFPVSEAKQPPCWNYTFSFHFQLCIITGMSYYSGLPNFIRIAPCAAD